MCRYASHHRANCRSELKYVSLTEEPFALALPPSDVVAENILASLPPPLDPAPPGSIPWSSLDPSRIILLDARSPLEYAADHIEGAINVPVLSDKERKEVGTIFTAGDVVEARLRGTRFACSNIAEALRPEGILTQLLKSHQHPGTQAASMVLVYCARGGQRSMGLASVLAELRVPGLCEMVACLAGGYRAWRRLLLRQLGVWPCLTNPGGLSGTLWVLSSLTGCGKTLLLEELKAAGESTLNLEGMAQHKGSVFGSGPGAYQLSQRAFEARLHTGLRQCLASPHVWTESESRSVGPRCHLGAGFWHRLRGVVGTKRVWITAPLEARVDWILKDYADWLEEGAEEKLESVLQSLATYHSRKRLESWRQLVGRRDYAAFVADLLEHHYDVLYRKSHDPLLSHYADLGLLHHLHLPVINRDYFRRKVVSQLIQLTAACDKFSQSAFSFS